MAGPPQGGAVGSGSLVVAGFLLQFRTVLLNCENCIFKQTLLFLSFSIPRTLLFCASLSASTARGSILGHRKALTGLETL
jgi:hypothetical protein